MELDILFHIQHRLHCAFLWVFHKTLLLHLRFYHRTSIFKKLIQDSNLDDTYKLVCLLRNMNAQKAIGYVCFLEPFLAGWTVTLKFIRFLVTINIQHYLPFDFISTLMALNGKAPTNITQPNHLDIMIPAHQKFENSKPFLGIPMAYA